MAWRAEFLDSEHAWILDEHENYLVELVTSDEMGWFIRDEKLREDYLRLMAASQDLRAVLGELVEQIEAKESLNPAILSRAKYLLAQTHV